MIQLTEEQKTFLNHHHLPLSAVFDASDLKSKEYKVIMKELDKYIAIGVTPCKAKGHTLRLRSGHCLQCKPEILAHFFRHYQNASIYVAASKQHKKIKIGYAKCTQEREKKLNTTKYGGIEDWEIIYTAQCKNAGAIESAIQIKLKDYLTSSEYIKNNKRISCYEIFSCNYRIVKNALNEIKKHFPKDSFKNEIEIENAEILYNFDNIINNKTIKKRNRSIDKNDDYNHNENKQPAQIRKSEFDVDSNNNISNTSNQSTELINQLNSLKDALDHKTILEGIQFYKEYLLTKPKNKLTNKQKIWLLAYETSESKLKIHSKESIAENLILLKNVILDIEL